MHAWLHPLYREKLGSTAFSSIAAHSICAAKAVHKLIWKGTGLCICIMHVSHLEKLMLTTQQTVLSNQNLPSRSCVHMLL